MLDESLTAIEHPIVEYGLHNADHKKRLDARVHRQTESKIVNRVGMG